MNDDDGGDAAGAVQFGHDERGKGQGNVDVSDGGEGRAQDGPALGVKVVRGRRGGNDMIQLEGW